MRLSWNEIRVRASKFAEDWKDAFYEKGETQTFYNEFFEIFGITRRRVASFEEPVKLLGNKRGFIDLLWKGLLLVEQKSAGRDLIRARQQALDYFPGLKEAELPRYILACDFQRFHLRDLEEDRNISFALAELATHVEEFGFLIGVQKRVFRDQDPANVIAAELMGQLHDVLKASGYDGHDLEQFLVRILFCLFADDTGIFDQRDMFLDLIQGRTREDGSDTGPMLTHLFEVLNTERRQQSLDEDLKRFPYINGDLFKERLPIPAFTATMRAKLIEACQFDWNNISPAIFGSLFQSVMDKTQRRTQGAHYTTEKNILKVIQPLFLDELHREFDRLKMRTDQRKNNDLKVFHEKIAALRFFDPACGCGNFLIIAYRELRSLEIEILKEIHGGQFATDVAIFSRIDVDQFYGIEISEFPARIAEVALWMMDHIMNNRLSLEFGQVFIRIPLRKSPHIHCADALETDWATVLPADQCDFVLGNPPFSGAKFQSTPQRAQVRRIAALPGSGGTLDYVCAWFIKAGEYLKHARHKTLKIGFVATNSISQGEQVAQLWPILFDRCELEIAFAHRTFAWGSDARRKAHVHVVIIGLTHRTAETGPKRLFSYSDLNGDPVESVHQTLSPYLFDAANLANRHIVVHETPRSLCHVPKMIIGSKPIDDGNYIFTEAEKSEFLSREPSAEEFMRPFLGAEEFINGNQRWILCLQKAAPQKLRALPLVKERVENVQKFRLASKSKPTQEIAKYPEQFHVNVIPSAPFLAVPRVSSERREYIPIGYLEPPVVVSDAVLLIENVDLYYFILSSAMHMAWLRHIGGRLKSDFRYSAGLVYNTFPWPEASEAQKGKIRLLAGAILEARRQFPDATLADLYDPLTMPAPLRKAHQLLDQAVDKLYRPQPFLGDRDRAEYLLMLYEKLTAPLTVLTNKPKTHARRKAQSLTTA